MWNNLFLTLLLSVILLAPSATMAATPVTKTFYCPQVGELKKDPNKMTWSADNKHFRSYDTSFSNKVDQFIGAQWVGTNVGQITCIYRAFAKSAFPVLLVFHTLTLEPNGNAWTKNLGGYKNCDTSDRKQCPFTIKLQQKSGDIYEEAERLKSNAPEPPTE